MISLKGFNEQTASFLAGGELEIGAPVALCGNNTVKRAGEGEDFIGVVVSLRGSLVGIQLCGYTRLGYSGAAPSLGYNSLAANGGGGVVVSSGARSLLVTDVDTKDTSIGIIL